MNLFTNKQKYQSITLSILSCGRPDLLEPTVVSLNNLFPISNFKERILVDDSLDGKKQNEIIKICKCFNIKFFPNKNKLYLNGSLDKLWKMIKTKYFLHVEDDWFFEKNPFFINQSLEILEENPNYVKVNIRHNRDLVHFYNCKPEHILKTKKSKIEFYRKPDQNWQFNFNPGLFDNEKIQLLIKEFGELNNIKLKHNQKWLEDACFMEMVNKKFDSVRLKNTACKHLGWNFSLNADTPKEWTDKMKNEEIDKFNRFLKEVIKNYKINKTEI